MPTDFALTPTGGADVSGTFGELLKLRPDTKLLGPEAPQDASSIKSFLRAVSLETDAVANLILTSHATASGSLALPLFDGDSSDLTYDRLTEALDSNALAVRASGDIINRAVANAGIIVKGCNLGRSPEFMALLQRAIAPTFGIIGSLYSHGAARDAGNGGAIEFMQYEFFQDYFLSKDNRFDSLDTGKVKALTRTRLIADMKANPRIRQFDGSSFSNAAWEAMIPRLPALGAGKPPKPIRTQFTVKFPPAWNLKPFAMQEQEGHRLLDVEKFEVTNVQLVVWDVGASTAPVNTSPISVRRDFMKTQLATNPTHQATHPYPVYKRYGFATLDEYVDHFDWGKLVDTTWVGKTWRFQKTTPLTNPATGVLICNRYTSTTRQEAMRETANLLFAAIAGA